MTAEPTATPEPTPAPIQPIDGTADMPVPIVPTGGGSGGGSGQTTLTFSATDWAGAYRGDQSWYGRPWAAIYGAQSPYPSGTLTFSLDEQPTRPASLYVMGVGDESGQRFSFGVDVNGSLGRIDGTLPNWSVAEHGATGQRAPWIEFRLEIASGSLQAGQNRISIVSLQDGATFPAPPYILLGSARLDLT